MSSNFQISNITGCYRTTPSDQISDQTGPEFLRQMHFLAGNRVHRPGPERHHELGLNGRGINIEQKNDLLPNRLLMCFNESVGGVRSTRNSRQVMVSLKNIRSLTIVDNIGFNNNSIIDLVNPLRFYDLTTLDLLDYEDQIVDEDLMIIAQKCPNLEKLRLPESKKIAEDLDNSTDHSEMDSTIVDNRLITSAGIREIGKRCKKCSSLELNGLIMDREMIKALAEFDHLTELILIDCVWIEEGIAAFEQITPRLRKLSLIDTYMDQGNAELFIRLVRGCNNLTELSLNPKNGCSANDVLEMLNTACPKLIEFSMEKMGFNFSIFKKFIEHHMQMKSIGIKRMHLSNTIFGYIADHCKDLEKIDLDMSLLKQGALGPLAQCSKLQSIIPGENRESIDDDTLIALATHCPDLREIDFYCGGVTKKGIDFLAQNSKNLRKVYLPNIKMDNKIVRAFAQNCPDLIELDIRNCGNITGSSIYELVIRCNQLKLLDISEIDKTKISFGALKTIVQSGRCLTLQLSAFFDEYYIYNEGANQYLSTVDEEGEGIIRPNLSPDQFNNFKSLWLTKSEREELIQIAKEYGGIRFEFF